MVTEVESRLADHRTQCVYRFGRKRKREKVAYDQKLLAHYVPLNTLGQLQSHSAGEQQRPDRLVDDRW